MGEDCRRMRICVRLTKANDNGSMCISVEEPCWGCTNMMVKEALELNGWSSTQLHDPYECFSVGSMLFMLDLTMFFYLDLNVYFVV